MHKHLQKALFEAINKGNVVKFQECVEHELFNPNTRLEGEHTVVQYLARFDKNVPCLKALLEKYTMVELNFPLITAIRAGALDVVTAMVQKDKTIVNIYHNDIHPLFVVIDWCYRVDYEIRKKYVDLLIENGADVNMFACLNDNETIVQKCRPWEYDVGSFNAKIKQYILL